MKASDIKTGMKFWDGSDIEVISSTAQYVNVSLSGGEDMPEGQSVNRKWKKTSNIEVSA